jgi:hypothetical protein
MQRRPGVINVTGLKPESEVSSQTSRPLDALLLNCPGLGRGFFSGLRKGEATGSKFPPDR